LQAKFSGRENQLKQRGKKSLLLFSTRAKTRVFVEEFVQRSKLQKNLLEDEVVVEFVGGVV